MSADVVVRHTLRPGTYFDSVVLMQLQRSLAALPGVVDAAAVMATPANRELLEASALLPVIEGSRADDLLVVVKAGGEAAADEALARVDELLRARASAGEEELRPRSLATAVRQLPEARWVLVSVPGEHAAAVADEALDLERSVFLYSDNVAVGDEVALKRKARAKGLLVMGPDCGTAMVGGVGMGFANRVDRGAVGLIGASGTGLQAVASRLHALGAGVSQIVGTGGRDLAAEVGGITTLQALDLLQRDPETRVIVLVSKPPAPAVAATVLTAARESEKPVVVHFVGSPVRLRTLGTVRFTASLAAAAEVAARLVRESDGSEAAAVAPAPSFASGQRFLRGLFSGGTLAYEALLGLQGVLEPLHSNLPLAAARPLGDPSASAGHTIIDLGSDELTLGRPHPMIDQELLLRRLQQEAADPEVALVLLDVVLGDGAHPDPAGSLAPAIARARFEAEKESRMLEVVAIVIGTDEDPQGLEGQIEALERAGGRVYQQLEGAVEHAALVLSGLIEETGQDAPRRKVDLGWLQAPVTAINVGLESFSSALLSQGAQAVQVDWRPPAGGNAELAAILSRLK